MIYSTRRKNELTDQLRVMEWLESIGCEPLSDSAAAPWYLARIGDFNYSQED